MSLKIKTPEVKKVRFDSVKIRHLFYVSGDLYMRCILAGIKGNEYNCVSLQDGYVRYTPDDAMVIPAKGELVIE